MLMGKIGATIGSGSAGGIGSEATCKGKAICAVDRIYTVVI